MSILCEEGMIFCGEVVLSSSWVDASSDAAVLAKIREMTELSNHWYLHHTHGSGTRSFDSIEEFYVALQEAKVVEISAEKKRELSAMRRREFRALRPDLELALIERDQYVCSHPDCNIITDLTIDHIVALSRGGSDELSNLRFLCRFHNSAKADK